MTWTTDSIPDLTGKRALITGVTGGLGTHTAIGLARKGAELLVTARDDAKAAATLKEIEREAPGSSVRVVELDLADLAGTKRAAAGVVADTDRLDVVINNAGIMIPPRRSFTADGYELQMGTNHIGHFAWTATLWPLLVSSQARVVAVASMAHTAASGIDLRVFTTEGSPGRYARWRSYAQSKLANLLFALELDRRTKAAGVPVVSVASHPGYAATNLTKTGPSVGGNSLPAMGMHQITRVIGQSARAGAWPLLMAATDPSLTGGEYVGPSGFQQMRGRPKLVGMTRVARDPELAAAVWAASESATGLTFDVA